MVVPPKSSLLRLMTRPLLNTAPTPSPTHPITLPPLLPTTKDLLALPPMTPTHQPAPQPSPPEQETAAM